MNIKKELQRQMKDVVTITLKEEIIKDCLNDYLEKRFNIKNTKYKLKRTGLDNDLIYVVFEEEEIYERVNGYDAIENAILYNLNKIREDGIICAFCSDINSTEFIHVMISTKFLDD